MKVYYQGKQWVSIGKEWEGIEVPVDHAVDHLNFGFCCGDFFC